MLRYSCAYETQQAADEADRASAQHRANKQMISMHFAARITALEAELAERAAMWEMER